jgi:hypothetical protein
VNGLDRIVQAATLLLHRQATARVLALAAGLTGLGLVAADCGGDSMPPSAASLTTTSAPASSASPSGSGRTTGPGSASAGVAFAACMRSHGAPNFPDPSSGGGFDLKVAGIDRSSPQVESANNACAALQPGGVKTPPRIRQHIKVLMAVARCMRAHGVPYFPAPNSKGAIVSSSGKWDPSSPQFQSAEKICNRLNPGTG